MSSYETWSLILTGIYDFLTLGLLAFVAYETIVKPRQPDLAFYMQGISEDTKNWSERRQTADFILENRGGQLSNVQIKSEPDFIGWGNLGKDGVRPASSTSEFFKQKIPLLSKNERHTFFWCDMEANTEVIKSPFKIIIEFDNPILPWLWRKRRKEFLFDFSTFNGTIQGVNTRFDIHNVALEAARIRAELEQLRKLGRVAIQATKDEDTDTRG